MELFTLGSTPIVTPAQYATRDMVLWMQWVNQQLTEGAAADSGLSECLEEHEASGSASLDFVDCITSAYDEYLIELVNLVPATDAQDLRLRFSSDGGTTWLTTTDYSWSMLHLRAGAVAQPGNEGGVAFISLTGGSVVTNVATWGITGSVRLFDPLSTTVFPSILGDCRFKTDTGTGNFRIRCSVQGGYEVAAPVNAFQVFMSSGNLASGIVRVYGVAPFSA